MSDEEDYDVVLATLQEAYDRRNEMVNQNAEIGMLNIMDDIRLEQMDELSKAIELWKSGNFLSTPEPTQEPIGYVITIDPSKSYRKDSWKPWKEVEGMNGGKIRDDIPDGSLVYLRPAPRQEFVRLSEEEIASWFGAAIEGSLIEFARAIEDALKEKNRG